MREGGIMKARKQRTAQPARQQTDASKRKANTFDWSAADALTDEEILAAALRDPDAQPLSDAQLARMKRPNPKVVRQALGLSQEGFAARFRIPVGTLRDWEQGRVEPDQAARAYLMVIARIPDAVSKALDVAA
jgi:putative transcriptional regulator